MRKRFTAGAVCLALLMSSLFGSSYVGTAEATQSRAISLEENDRTVLNFNTDWLFIDEDDTAASESDYDESGAEEVSLPHSLGEYDLFYEDGSSWQKVTWYRRHFTLSEEYEGDRVTVSFDGGGQINEVYVNGAYVGTARGTFTHFSFDISDYITYGDYDNVISIRVDSNYHYDTLPPAENDFHWMGGLHGDAEMVITDSLHLESVFYWTEKIGTDTYQQGEPVSLKGEVEVTNEYSEALDAIVHTELIDADGNMVASQQQALTVAAGATEMAEMDIQVDNPNLWNTETPYLYTTQTWIESGGVRLDSEDVRTGLRWITTTGKSASDSPLTEEDDQQILLNDEVITLYGINKNMQFAYIGNSGTSKLQAKDAYTLKYDLGVNFVRTAHYENDPDFFEACDEIGLLVEEEALGWQTMEEEARPQFYDSVMKMVERDRNHASIIIWSIMPNEGNETNYPVDERYEIEAGVKELDSSRLTIQEEMNYTFEFVTDVYANHDYVVSTNSTPMKEIYRQPYVIGEWNDNLGRVFTNPYDSEERKIRQITSDGKKLETFMSNSTVDGIVKWDFNGYLSTINNYLPGKSIGAYRISGVYGPFKDPLVRYWEGDMMRVQLDTSNYTIGNVISIMNEWKEDSSSTVYVAANADYAELFLVESSGKETSQGRIEPNALTGLWQGLFQWDDVTWSEGSSLRAVSYDADGNVLAEDVRYASSYEVETEGVSYELTNVTANIYTSEHYLTYGNNQDNLILQADGSDLAVIAGVLKDANGQKEDYGYENTTFEIVSGPGTLITGPTVYMLGGVNSCYLQTETGQTGETVIRASVDIGELYNQDDTAHFSYSSTGWTTVTDQDCSYEGDYRKSSASGSYVEITFTGTQAVLYAQMEYSGYGSGTVYVDGTEVGSVSFQKGENKTGDMDFQPVYTTDTLEYGAHTIRIEAASSSAITVDAVKVFDGITDVVSNDLVIQTVAMEEETVPCNPELPSAPTKEKVEREDVETLLEEAKEYDLDMYEAEGSLALYQAIRYAEQVLSSDNPSNDDLRTARNGLNQGISGLMSVITTVSYENEADNPGGMGAFYRYSQNESVWVTGENDLYANKSRTAGDYVSLSFEGAKICLYAKKGTNYGMAAIYIDDVLMEEVDMYADEDVYPVLIYESEALLEGTHIIRLEVTGETTGNSSNACVGVCYAEIYRQAGNTDKSELAAAIEEAKLVEQGEYSDSKYQAYLESIDDAQFIYDHPYAGESDVKAAMDELAEALVTLQQPDEPETETPTESQTETDAGTAVQPAQAGTSQTDASAGGTSQTIAAPTIKSLKAKAAKSGVTVQVKINGVSGADHYAVYRVVNGKTTLVGKTASGKTTLTDSKVTGKKITYYAVALSGDGSEISDKGAGKTITMAGKPKVKSAKALSNGVLLKWSKTKNATKYVIYRSTKKNSGYTKIGTVSSKKTTYTDKKAKKGKKYYYKIVAVKKGQVSLMSNAKRG